MTKENNIVARLRQDRKILWIAVGCGVLATILLSINLQEEQPEMAAVLVATKAIPAGGKISYNSVTKQTRPAKYVPERRVPPDYLDQYGEFQTNMHLEAGELILWSYISTDDESSFSKALDTEHNMRLISISIDEVKGLAGHVKQNDIVDVLWTGTIPTISKKGIPSAITKVLLEGVTVAAVGQARSGMNMQQQYAAATSATSVTLKLSQDEAALLTFAESVGNIKLILSHQDVLPANVTSKKGGIEISYDNIKKAKTVSKTRANYIRITYGSGKK